MEEPSRLQGHRESEITEQLTHTHTHTHGSQRVRHNWATNICTSTRTHTHTHTHTYICCCCSVSRSYDAWLLVTPWTASHHFSLSFTIFQNLLKLMSIESVMLSNHLILYCHFLPSIFPSKRVFSNESILHILYPEYWSFSFRISSCNEYSGLVSFRIDWFYLLASQVPHKCFLMHHSSKAPILQCSAFLMVQLSHQCSF